MRPEAEAAHHDLIDQLVARGALWSRPLLAAFRATPRQFFLDRVWRHGDEGWQRVETASPGNEELRIIYSDRALTTRLASPGHGRAPVAVSSSSQPSLMAQMLEDLDLRPAQRVLEVGSGTGYNAALIAHVVGRVVSIDVDREVLSTARQHLEAFPDRLVELHHADGRDGYPPGSPYDRLLVTAAADDLEPAWLEQMAPGGVVLAPLDVCPGMSYLVRGVVHDSLFEGQLTRPAYFMPLRDEDSTGREEPVAADRAGGGPVPPADRMQCVSAPWAAWAGSGGVGRRDFLPALALLGWLQGLTLRYATVPDGRSGFGLADLVKGHACWLGQREWWVSGKGGHSLADDLWRAWLDAGGPAPTEYRLQAVPPWRNLPEAREELSFRREGLRCAHRWELPATRARPEPV